MVERGLLLFVLTFFVLFLFFLTFIFRQILYQFLTILLIMVLLGIYYLFLNAEFIAAIQVIVYAGAILIMFLFTIFLFPEEELKYSRDILKTHYSSFLPLGFFLALFLFSLFKAIPKSYKEQNFYFDLKILSKILFNDYWITIYILAFLLSLPMIALYIFFKREERSGSN